ncbi:obscurin-like [Cebidichthys violaceus]|uniref:obscurin-like n=1 Tax=Cebidichthys violaceus TaxID=271503 RepID=UPI0035C965C0
MGHTVCVPGLFLLNILLYCGHAQDVLLSIEPNWSTLFTGETVTFICDMREGEVNDWDYSVIKDGQTIFPYRTEKRFTLQSLTTGYSGEYQCVAAFKIFLHFKKQSNKISITVSEQPKAQLRKGSPVGDSVTLTCSVGSSSSSSGWKYFWYRSKKTSEPLTTPDVTVLSTEQIRVSGGGGVYWCRGGRGDPVYYTEYSDPVVTNRAIVTLQPDWPEIYSGETITLTCEIKDGGDSEWEYEWRTPSSYRPLNPRGSMIRPSHSGDYWCKGRMKDDTYSTGWSDTFTIKVSDKPQPVLTVSPLWLSPGDSVTLNCSVKHPSAGWRFFWYKAVPKLSNNSYISELLPGSTNGTEQDSYIVHGQTHTAGYVCRAGRGDPVFYTHYSEHVFVWSGDFHSAASLTVSPDRVQHFNKDSLSLSCEGNSTEWRVSRFYESGSLVYCSVWGTMTGSTCNMDRYWRSGVYWCESETQFSNAANITIQNGGVILVSPVRPVTEGHSVTLGCKLKTEKVLYDVEFYKNDKLIINQTRGELFISAVTKSDEGFYKCRGTNSPQGLRSLTSAESWLSVKYSEDTAASSPFPVLLVVGLVCGVLLIILLLLFLYRCRKSKDSSVMRSQSTNQSPATDHMINQVETPNGHYASLLHGDSCLYETIRGSEEPEHGKNNEPEERVYSNVTMGTAAGTVKRRWRKHPIQCCSFKLYKKCKSLKSISQKQSDRVSVLDVRMGHTVCVPGLFLLNILLYCGHAQDVLLSIEPNWSTLFTGETVTFICGMRKGEVNDWYYSVIRNGYMFPPNSPDTRFTSQPLTREHNGQYQCVAARKISRHIRKESNKVSITVSERPKAQLRKGSPVGDSVTLTCSVGSSSSSSSSGWKYFWYRSKKTSKALNTRDDVLLQNERISVSRGGRGVYWCRGGRGDPVYYTEYSDPVVTNRAVVTLQTDWPEIYSGETITLTCEIKDGGDSEWEYEWRTPSSYRPQNPRGSMIRPSHSGDYWCNGRLKDETSSTEWSDTFTLKLSPYKHQPVLTVSPLWLSPGDSVTLTCSVKHPSAGWRFFWYKAVPKQSHYYSFISELLPGSTNGTEQNSYIVHGQTHTAGYVCRAGRGDPVFNTQYSERVFVWSGDFHSAASLTVSPDRVQHFNKDSLSLSCEGNSTEWRVSRFYESGSLVYCSVWGTMTGSTCNMDRYWRSGVYWCESETGQFSNAANITIQNGGVILVSPVRPVTEGHSVTLGCKLKTEKVLYDVEFYKNGKLIPNHTRGELFISAVTKSDEGFYKCRGTDSTQGLRSLTSAESWLSVKYSEDTAASSPFPVLLVVGLVCGVLLIILLLLFLYRCRKSKDSSVMRSQSTNQSPATDHKINQVETQDRHYASLLHGDSCLYETIRGSEEPEHGKNNKPEERVYSNVTMGTAADQ